MLPKQVSLSELLQQGLDEFNGGNFVAAEAAYRRVLAIRPDHPDANHLLGLVAYSVGKHEIAVDLINKANEIQPGVANFHNNLGNALRSLGQTDAALEAYQYALALDPVHPHALCNIGTAYYDRGDLDDAIGAYRRALELDPVNTETLNNLAIALKDDGKIEEAMATCRQATTMDPNSATAWNSLGNALMDIGETGQGIDAYRRAIDIKPDNAEVLNNLGFSLESSGDPSGAIEACRRAISLRPEYALAYLNLGLALKSSGSLDDAIANFRRAVEIDPTLAKAFNALGVALYDKGQFDDSVDVFGAALALEPNYAVVHNNLAASLESLGQYEQAIESYHKSIELAPNRPEAFNNLGVALETVGQFDEAVDVFHQALELQPGYAQAYKNLSSVVDFKPGDPNIPIMESLAEDTNTSNDDLSLLSFALGKAYENTGDYEKVFDALAKGNRLYRDRLTFDPADVEALFDRIIATFDSSFCSSESGDGYDSDLPIFIVGMPRSGTSLVEQILASHPQVHGAGELRDVSRLAIDLPRRFGLSVSYPECATNVAPEDWAAVGQDYVNGLQALSPDSPRISDKMPPNHQYIGLINRVLPNAAIIHCVRDPVDTCLSCFKTLFREGQLYSFDLTELGLYYRQYKRLDDHWKKLLPNRMLDIRYEDVIEDLEGSARRLVAHCGLDWDDACLDFHSNKRPVHTASAGQVRRPIYTSSMGRWRRYEKHLAPLLDALGPLVEP